MTDFSSCSQRLPDGGIQYIIMTQVDRAFLLAAVRYFWLPLHFWLTSKIVPKVDFRRWGPEDAGGYSAKKTTLPTKLKHTLYLAILFFNVTTVLFFFVTGYFDL